MANETKIILPPMGEGITDARITRWLVKIGDTVEIDQPVVEIATDKVDSEVPSTTAGIVKEFLYHEGETPQVGQPILVITSNNDYTKDEALNTEEPTKPNATSTPSDHSVAHQLIATTKGNEASVHLSPLVRKIATDEGISALELEQINGSGLHNRITKDDIQAYLQKRNKKNIEKHAETKVGITDSFSPIETSARQEIIPMDRMRKLIAEHMVMSKQTSAHVTSFIEVDATNLVEWRNRNKDAFQQIEGQKLTLTHLLAEQVVKTIKMFPQINSSVSGDNIIVKKDINLSVATALPNGNLIVPVVRNADKLSLSGLTQSINDLANRARENKLKPDEIQGGTFTITNLGMFDTLTGTPIINQPQVAILAIGAIKKRPVVMETQAGDVIAIRQISILSISYDHRIVDGALAGNFLKTLRNGIEEFNKPNIKP